MTLAALAEGVGARDLFVLQSVDAGRLVNLDGFGRGAGWAGNLTVDPEAEPWLSGARPGVVHRHASGVPERILGPYWATAAAAIQVGEAIVVLGGEGLSGQDDGALIVVAREAAAAVAEVPVAKRLADELEVSQAALSIATLRPASLRDAAVEIATRSAEALSCEFGAVLLLGPPIEVFMAREGWRPTAAEDEVIAALLPIARALQDDLIVEQDLSCSAFPYHPLSFEDGLVARATVPLSPDGTAGMLVVAHAASTPRGFTTLCQRVLVTIARAADVVLSSAMEGTVATRS